MSILDQILAEKEKEISHIAKPDAEVLLRDAAEKSPAPRGFAAALCAAAPPAVIAEIKRASPSRGIIREDLSPIGAASAFAGNGAACLSVLTDEKFFAGKLDFLREIRREQDAGAIAAVPLLRKDFIIHPAQVWQSRLAGADAALLIAAALSQEQLSALLAAFNEARLDVLLEVHNEEELHKAAAALTSFYSAAEIKINTMLGINNRNLSTFAVDLQTTQRLAAAIRQRFADNPLLSSTVIVSESGIAASADMRQLAEFGASAFLIGESLTAAGEPGVNLARLIADFRGP